MKPVHFIIIGLVLTAGLVIAIIAQRDQVNVASVPATNPHPEFSSDAAPSKENVAAGVRKKADELRHIIEQNPNDAKRVFELARLQQDSHNMGEAVKLYERGLKIQPANHDARIDYSVCLFESGKKAEALVQTRMVLRSEPGNAKALYNAGALYGNKGVPDSARMYWNKLMAIHPEDDLALQAKKNLDRLGSSIGSK